MAVAGILGKKVGMTQLFDDKGDVHPVTVLQAGPCVVTQRKTATKDGYFGPGSPQSLGHDVNNDAGLLIFPDGRVYVAAFTAFDAVELESDVVGLVIRSLMDDPGLINS